MCMLNTFLFLTSSSLVWPFLQWPLWGCPSACEASEVWCGQLTDPRQMTLDTPATEPGSRISNLFISHLWEWNRYIHPPPQSFALRSILTFLLSLNFRKIDWLVAAKKDILKRKICYLVKIFDLSFVRISKYHKDTVITNELSSIIPRVWKLE